ncbi:sulfotransferase family protein [Mangrovimicrobium sediminis]|uniref:Sulfotransferase family protein n=1 Tax=Mangrovimicrobium sediminis TaxID=2562682 RepID=A0A4Z0LXJ8_9GAMM|nr:sulfotransferase [Haliea sp. SAOS-164]TGD71867.1 sulfotransferase family protein [Haliea sp. SAOS-164]
MELRDAFGANPRRLPLARAMRLAAAAAQRGDHGAAEHIYSQAMEQCPQNAGPACRLLASLRARGEDEAAQMLAYRLQAMFPDDADPVIEVAAFYSELGEPARALSLLSGALERAPAERAGGLQRALADTFITTGEAARAAEHFDLALQSTPGDVLAMFGLSQIAPAQRRADLLPRLEAMERGGEVPAHELPHLYFALAYLCQADDPARYFHYLQLANRCVATDAGPYLGGLREHYLKVEALFTPSLLAACAGHEAQSPAPVLVLAPPRSGTTLVEQVLGAHPQLHPVGESLAFVAAYNQVLRERQAEGPLWQWQPGQLHEALPRLERHYMGHQRLRTAAGMQPVDKSIENIRYLGLILLAWPRAKVIRLRRHPLDTIVSCYHQFFTGGFTHLFDLEALAHYYLLFQQYMDFWQARFPDNFVELEYEALASRPEESIRKLLADCGLPFDKACLEFHRHVGSVVTASKLQVRQPVHSAAVARWKPFARQLQPAITILERELQCEFS